jgi:hypothetical protein
MFRDLTSAPAATSAGLIPASSVRTHFINFRHDIL